MMNQLLLNPIGRFRIVNEASYFFDENEKKKALAIKVCVIAAAVFTVITLAALLLPSHPFIFTFGVYATCYLAFVSSYFFIIKMMEGASGNSTITFNDKSFVLTKGKEHWKIEQSDATNESYLLTTKDGQAAGCERRRSTFLSLTFNLESLRISRCGSNANFVYRT